MNSRKRLRWVLPPSLLGLLVGVHYHYTWRNQKPYFDQNVVRKLDAAQSSLYTPYDNTTSCTLPDWTRHLVDVWEPFDLETSSDTPFLWTIPQAGGDTIMSIFSSCLGLTLANHQGKDTHNQTLFVSQHGQAAPFVHAPRFVNVQTDTKESIDWCRQRGLLESGLADVVATNRLVYASQHLLSSQHKARGFVMLRHPVQQIMENFAYLRLATTWETDEEYAEELTTMSLFNYSRSDQMPENQQVRTLLGLSSETTLTLHHVETAKHILRRKFVVGIYEWFDVSIVRYEKYFGWWDRMNVLRNESVNNCHYHVIERRKGSGVDKDADNNNNNNNNNNRFHKRETTTASANTYSILLSRNWADVELYHAAKTLFAEQAKLI